MHVKAHEYVGGEHVCDLPEKDRKGVIHLKPSSFSDKLEIEASVICDACPCEQVLLLASVWSYSLRNGIYKYRKCGPKITC